MLLVDVPAVLVGKPFAARLATKLTRMIAASLFALIGLIALLKFDKLPT